MAITAMVAANFTMVAVMTMTPVYVQWHGQGLHVIGGVISAHMVGMFVLSPLSGRLADRRGGRPAVALGVAALVTSAVVSGTAPATDTVLLSMGVFLLGFGWNLCWVGGSSLLTRGLEADELVQTQSDVDAIVWSTSAVASVLSGALLATGGFGLLAAVGGGVALLPMVPIVLSEGRSRAAKPAHTSLISAG